MSFQIHALPAARFAGLFALSDADLRARNARRMVVNTYPGTPCRVSMVDAAVGETVILANFTHQPANTPYRASHAVFVREGASQACFAAGEVPAVLRTRLISLRLFDPDHLMIDADVVEGTGLAHALETAFEAANVAYIQLHYAKPGCFAAHATRAG